jgi:hypothetical protein
LLREKIRRMARDRARERPGTGRGEKGQEEGLDDEEKARRETKDLRRRRPDGRSGTG